MAELTTEQLKKLVQDELSRRGLSAYWPIVEEIVQRESGWDPKIQSGAIDPRTGKKERSWGLFQLYQDGGLGTGYSANDLKNPQTNIRIALDDIQGKANQGKSLRVIFSPWMAAPGAFEALGISGEEVPSPGGYGPQQPSPGGEVTQSAAGGSIVSQVKAWLGDDEAYVMDPVGWTNLWFKQTQGAEAEPIPVSTALQAHYAYLDAQVAAGEIDAKTAADRYLRAVDKETLEQGRLSEAGQRAQQVQGILEKRAMLTLPGKYVPGTRPTDILAQSMASRGRTFQPEEGIPLSSLPDPWELFRQANLSVGLPGELEPLNLPEVQPTPNIYAQQLPAYEDVATRMWGGAGLGGETATGGGTPTSYPSADLTASGQPLAATDGQAAWERFRAGAASVPVPPPPPQAGALPNDWLRKYLASIGIQLPRLA